MSNCNLNKLTVEEVQALALEALARRTQANDTPPEGQTHPYQIGACYLIRTVTLYLTGRVIWVGEHEIQIADPAWIADTGRFNKALASGKVAEVEPGPSPCIVGRGAIVDAWPWHLALPREVQ